MTPVRPTLHVCTTCRAGRSDLGGSDRPGARLFEALNILNIKAGEPVDLRPISCLAACDRGCTAAISMPERFSYLLGGMDPDTAQDVFDYAGRYAASPTGLVLPSRRPGSLRHAILGRVPGAEVDVDST